MIHQPAFQKALDNAAVMSSARPTNTVTYLVQLVWMDAEQMDAPLASTVLKTNRKIASLETVAALEIHVLTTISVPAERPVPTTIPMDS